LAALLAAPDDSQQVRHAVDEWLRVRNQSSCNILDDHHILTIMMKKNYSGLEAS
jgi:hypothetical protein